MPVTIELEVWITWTNRGRIRGIGQSNPRASRAHYLSEPGALRLACGRMVPSPTEALTRQAGSGIEYCQACIRGLPKRQEETMARLTANQIERGNCSVYIILQTTTCPECAITFAGPGRVLEDARGDASITLYCPAGHPIHWPDKSEEKEKLRDRLARANSNADRQRARADDNERRRIAQKAATTRAKGRGAAALCPVEGRGRSFKQLRRHLEKVHPNYDLTGGER